MIASFFSRKPASRSRIVSRMPPASPAATMLTNSPLKAPGCFSSASARVLPLSTSYTTCRVTSDRSLFSVCFARMSSACTNGRPALIIVANCRVNMTTSRVGTRFGRFFLTCSRTRTTTMRFCRSCWTTSSRDSALRVPVVSSPVGVRAVYSKTGMERTPLVDYRRPAIAFLGDSLASPGTSSPIMRRNSFCSGTTRRHSSRLTSRLMYSW